MRFVVVDVGNTSTAVGLWSDGRVRRVTHCDGGFAEAAPEAERLLARCTGAPEVVYLSVVPRSDVRWRAWARREGVRFRPIGWRDVASIRLDYPHPETIGADRLADAVGAVARYGAPVLVMDFGTALTAAVVTGDRTWRGGVIAPGFPLMRDYLFERTAKLPRLRLGIGRAPKIGRSTEESMRFGALVGYRGMVREIVGELRKNFGEGIRLVATGGFAKWALRDIGLGFTVDPTLTLYGAGLVGSVRLGGNPS